MFRVVSILAAGVCLILFVILLISPATYVGTYGIGADAGAAFMVRRASPMFAGMAVMLWLGRDLGGGVARTAIGIGIATTFTGIALTGIAEFWEGTANAVILAAAAGEMLIAGLFVVAIRGR